MALLVGYAVNAVGGALVAALGVFVLTVRPRARGVTAFAAFLILFGTSYTLGNLADPADATPVWIPLNYVGGVLALGAGVALYLMAAWLPAPMHRSIRPHLFASVAAVVVVTLLLAVLTPAAGTEALVPDGAGAAFVTAIEVNLALTNAFLVSTWGAAFVLAARFRHADADATARRQFATISGAICFFPGFLLGSVLVGLDLHVLGLTGLVCATATAGAWLYSTRGPEATAARNVALAVVAAPLLGLLTAVLMGGFFSVDRAGVFGIVRALTVLFLAYAILRSRLLGLDVKVRWTIKNSTVAAVFIGVFFVVSETAQAAFASRTGSQYIGIAAAGMLLFAIAPLQRVAERVAQRAVPDAGPAPRAADDRLAAYRRHVEIAWADGVLAANERLMLRELRSTLGIGAEEAEAIDADVAKQHTRSRRR